MRDLIRWAAGAMLDAWQLRADLRTLSMLSDRQLDDIGITRAQIAILAAQPVPGGARRRRAQRPAYRSELAPCG